MTRAATTYLALLAAETAAATVIFAELFPLFRTIVADAGQPQPLPASLALPVLAAALVLQACYWTRYHGVAIPAPIRSPLLGHLLLFLGRASFIFGSATFSAIAFRHVPSLATLPALLPGLVKATGFALTLFSLFCYATEIERLGRAIEGG